MIIHRLYIVIIISVCASSGFSRNILLQQSVTLYTPHDKAAQKYDEGKACFSFKFGARKEVTNGHWDLGFGFAAINGEDWFVLSTSHENRSVIRDLGELTWTDSFKTPSLEPLPKLPEGEPRKIIVDASADTGKNWEKTTNIMAKVVTGHIYVMHIKDEESDFYAMFRVEEFKQSEFCTITWRLIETPEQ